MWSFSLRHTHFRTSGHYRKFFSLNLNICSFTRWLTSFKLGFWNKETINTKLIISFFLMFCVQKCLPFTFHCFFNYPRVGVKQNLCSSFSSSIQRQAVQLSHGKLPSVWEPFCGECTLKPWQNLDQSTELLLRPVISFTQCTLGATATDGG